MVDHAVKNWSHAQLNAAQEWFRRGRQYLPYSCMAWTFNDAMFKKVHAERAKRRRERKRQRGSKGYVD